MDDESMGRPKPNPERAPDARGVKQSCPKCQVGVLTTSRLGSGYRQLFCQNCHRTFEVRTPDDRG